MFDLEGKISVVVRAPNQEYLNEQIHFSRRNSTISHITRLSWNWKAQFYIVHDDNYHINDNTKIISMTQIETSAKWIKNSSLNENIENFRYGEMPLTFSFVHWNLSIPNRRHAQHDERQLAVNEICTRSVLQKGVNFKTPSRRYRVAYLQKFKEILTSWFHWKTRLRCQNAKNARDQRCPAAGTGGSVEISMVTENMAR